MAFGAKPDHRGENQDIGRLKPRQSPRIAELIPQRVLDGSSTRSQNGANVVKNSKVRNRAGCNPMRRLQKVRIKILRTVREEYHQRHQEHEITEYFPIGNSSLDYRTHGGNSMLLPCF